MSMRLVMFDLDGTLIDSHALITAAMADAFVAEGLEPPTALAGRQVIGLSLPEALNRLSGLDGGGLDALVARYRDVHYTRATAGEMLEGLYPGVSDLLLKLSAQPETLMGIATGKAMRGVKRVLEQHGFTDLFATFQTPDNNPSKPHPSMLQKAMVETGAGPEATVMIGDTTFDMEMAKAARTRAIGVTWGSHSARELTAAGADLIIDGFPALAGAIDDVFRM